MDDESWAQFWEERAAVDARGAFTRPRRRRLSARHWLLLAAFAAMVWITVSFVQPEGTWLMATSVTIVDDGAGVVVGAALPEGCWELDEDASVVADGTRLLLNLSMRRLDDATATWCLNGARIALPLDGDLEGLVESPAVYQRGCVSGVEHHRGATGCGAGFPAQRDA